MSGRSTFIGAAVLLSSPASYFAANGHSCPTVATCVAFGSDGACVSASAGCCETGTLYTGMCPGSSDIQCCVEGAADDDDGGFGENAFYYEHWCGSEVNISHARKIKLNSHIYDYYSPSPIPYNIWMTAIAVRSFRPPSIGSGPALQCMTPLHWWDSALTALSAKFK